MQTSQFWKKDNYLMRSVKASDAEAYYQAFHPLDSEIIRYTACKEIFSYEEVMTFFQKSLQDKDRYLFLIFSEKGEIVGETVINDIDFKLKSANFRIAISQVKNRDKGIGSWATTCTRDFAFEKLNLHRLSLEVFSFNPRAKKCYLKAGFKAEGCLREAILDGDSYADIIPMSILREEWLNIST
ncbi:MAG: GNAT family N-acetyltransferase [Lactovum sp.]